MVSMDGHNTEVGGMAGILSVKTVLDGELGMNSEELVRHPEDALRCGRMFLVSSPGHRSEIQDERSDRQDHIRKY